MSSLQDFQEVTDKLIGKRAFLMARMANKLNMSEIVLRQSRISKDKPTRRAPPSGWKLAALEVAIEYIQEYGEFVKELQADIEAKRG